MNHLRATSILIAVLLAGVASAHAEFRHYSSRMIAGTGVESMQGSITGYYTPKLLAADAAGNVVLIASTGSVMSFGSTWLGPGTVMAALDRNGAERWSRVLTTPPAGYARILCIAATRDKGMVIVGDFRDPVDFGAGALTSVQQSIDAFVVKLDSTGTVAWQHAYGDRNDQTASYVALDPDGNIVVTGANAGTADFGGGALRSNGGDDVFLLKLDPDGRHIWSRQYGQLGFQEGLCLGIGADGGIVLSVRLYSGGLIFGLRAYSAIGGDDIVMAAFDAGGNLRWSRQVASTYGERAVDVAVDAGGNATFGGWFTRAIDFGGGIVVAEPYATRTGFLASYRANGQFRWSEVLGDSLFSSVNSVATDPSGNVYMLAQKYGRFTVASRVLLPSGFLLVAMDAHGEPLCGGAYGVAPERYINHTVAYLAASGDRVVLAGSTDAPINFGGETLEPAQSSDVFVATLGIRHPPNVSIETFTACLDGSDVDVRWNVTGREALQRVYLTRRTNGGPEARVLHVASPSMGEGAFRDRSIAFGPTYRYALNVETALGDLVSASASIETPALKTSLDQNTPNPFNPLTTFSYTLATPAHVSIAIYDLSGALVCKLDQGMQPAGRHQAQWAGHTWEGNPVASGVYFYRLEGAGAIPARKMLLLK